MCPIIAKKTPSCIDCPSCGITEWMAGAGAFSDGKYVASTEYGGWLPDLLDDNIVIKYIENADKIIFAVCRVGSRFFANWCTNNDIPLQN
ncbi:MAG: hypothetical protein ACRCZK_02780 [Oscillospiraceae bacterium]